LTSCPIRHPFQPEIWCDACAREYERWLEEQTAQASLTLAARTIDGYRPASHEEWLEYWDGVAPLVP
jgi:hypothetical protein